MTTQPPGKKAEQQGRSNSPIARMLARLPKFRADAMDRAWKGFAAAPGRALWPLIVAIGLAAGLWFGLRALLGDGGSPSDIEGPYSVTPSRGFDPAAGAPANPSAASQGANGPQLPEAGGRLILALAMLAALAWGIDWLRRQRFAPVIGTMLKVLLALAPISVGALAGLDGVYRPMAEPLPSYLLLIACPFAAAGVLVALDRRRAWWLAPLALLVLAVLVLGAGALGRSLDEPVQHLRAALTALSPDQRMWWIALALTPGAVFAAVSTIGDRPKTAAG